MSRVALLVLLLSVLSLSSGRTVSRCELRDELEKVVTLPRRLQRIRAQVLAQVICEVEKLSYLETSLEQEFTKEVIKLDGTTTTSPNTTTTNTTTTTTTTTPAPPTTPPPTNTTTAPPPPTNTTTAPPPPTNTTTAPPPPTTSQTTIARHRREARKKRAFVEVTSVRFYGIFQLCDHVHCDSGYHASENRCSADCSAFSDEDITDDVQCFIKSGRFWEIYRQASDECKSKKTTEVFFDACDDGDTGTNSGNGYAAGYAGDDSWLSIFENYYK